MCPTGARHVLRLGTSHKQYCSPNFTAGSTPQRATRPRARLKTVNTPPRDRQPRAAGATAAETPAMEQAQEPLLPGAYLPDLDEPEFH